MFKNWNIVCKNRFIGAVRSIKMRRLVEVHYFTKNGKRDEFYKEIIKRGIADSARAEAGNEKYEYYFSPDNDNEIILLEVWSSLESVQLHMETPHFRELTELKKAYIEETVFNRYEILPSDVES